MNFMKQLIILFFICTSTSFAYFEVFQRILQNGFTILVVPTSTFQKVSCQLWYKVGSKHEGIGQKGIAHLIEHMIFKGTAQLSETDIPAISNKLSAYCNASTNYDWTKYYFDVPVSHWENILPIMADCMNNCTFKQDLLNAEYKAVLQELRIGKDNYSGQLFQKLMHSILYDHPYHYPVIGFKHDLCAVSSKDLHSFYKKYYGPNNAVLIVVGNVKPEYVFTKAEELFGLMRMAETKLPEMPLHYDDMTAHDITVYRDVDTALCFMAYPIPGSTENNSVLLDLLTSILADGQHSRLKKELIYKESLVRGIGAYTQEFYDNSLFVIGFQPYQESDIEKIVSKIQDVLNEIANGSITKNELEINYKKLQTGVFAILEDNSALANLIGSNYLATGNTNGLFDQIEKKVDLRNEISVFVKNYLRPIRRNKAILLPIPENEKDNWMNLQKEESLLDAKILGERIRQSEIEPVQYAKTIDLDNALSELKYPKPHVYNFDNNLTALVHNNSDLPTFHLLLRLKANSEYDSSKLPGLYKILCLMMKECGTNKHTASELIDLLESHAIRVQMTPDLISVSGVSEDLKLAIELLVEILRDTKFDEETLNRVKQWAIADCKNVNDIPDFHAEQLLMDAFYNQHPYSKNPLGTPESIQSINLEDIKQLYQQFVSPDKATLAIVGDLKNYDIEQMLQHSFGTWCGQTVTALEYPELSQPLVQILRHSMDRDQVRLIIAGRSIDLFHPDYDKLVVFSNIFGQGMQSLLFQLREKTGLFYEISGSMLYYSSHQPGLWLASCMVSPENVEFANKLIRQTILEATQSITDDAVEDAKRSILIHANDFYATNSSIAGTFLYLNKYKLPWNHFETRREKILRITTQDVKNAVNKILDLDHAVTVQVGPV